MGRDFSGYLKDRPHRLSLSPRQLEALRYTSHGCGMLDAGRAMGISMWTVDGHLEQARLRLAAKNTTHAVAIALRLGLID
jgi:DNA-binding CsgD family transcriptional regulator